MRLRVALAVVMSTLVLAACHVDVDVRVHVRADGSGVIEVAVQADAEAVAKAPEVLTDVRTDDLAAAGWAVTGPTRTADGAAVLTLRHPFADPAEATALLASLNGPLGPLHAMTLTRADGRASLTGVIRLDEGVQAFSDGPLARALGSVPLVDQVAADGRPLSDLVSLHLRVELPGTLDASLLDVEGGAAVYDLPLTPGVATPVRVEASDAVATTTTEAPRVRPASSTVATAATDRGARGTWRSLALLALCVYAGAVAGGVAWLRRRRSKTPKDQH